jgi:hypothetical protein
LRQRSWIEGIEWGRLADAQPKHLITERSEGYERGGARAPTKFRLGGGIYFWEQNPFRALEYAIESSQRKQFNNIPIKTPFVIGALIDLGNCLNLTESSSIKVLISAYKILKETQEEAGRELPVNRKNNRALDCDVIEYIHESNLLPNRQPYDTVRCAFPEGEAAYPTSFISSRLHIQICVRNSGAIKGFFLPQLMSIFNPFLQRA